MLCIYSTVSICVDFYSVQLSVCFCISDVGLRMKHPSFKWQKFSIRNTRIMRAVYYSLEHLPFLLITHACTFVLGAATYVRSFVVRAISHSLESQTAGLQSLWLASRLKPWLRTIDGLRWLMAASHGLRVQTRKWTAANQHSHISLSHYYVKSNTENSNDAVRELALEKYS